MVFHFERPGSYLYPTTLFGGLSFQSAPFYLLYVDFEGNIENEDVKKYATYVDKDTLLKESDAISLHLPLFKSTYHLINKETIQKMKDNVILLNCSRGELIDTEDIIEAIESKNKIQNLLRCACSSLLMVIGYSGFLKNASTLWKYFKIFSLLMKTLTLWDCIQSGLSVIL